MLRSRAVTIAATALLSLGLAACGSDSLSEGGGTSGDTGGGASPSAVTADQAIADKVPDEIKKKGTLVVGTDATYQPNEYLDTDGKTVIGMDVDLFDAVAAKMGLKTQWQPASFDSIILGVGSGKFDVGVSSFTINEDRMKQASMVSYYSAGTMWVTQKGNPKQINPDDACGKNIAMQKGTVQSDVDLPARQNKCKEAGKPAINALIDADQGKVTTMVVSGKADAMLVDSPPAIAAVNNTDGQLELLGEMYDSAPYGFVIPKDQQALGEAMVEALKALETDGTYTEILTKWKGEGGAIDDFAVNPDVSS